MSDHGPQGEMLRGNYGDHRPCLSKPLQNAYRKWYDSLTDAQLAKLGGRPHPSNLTAEPRPLLKEMSGLHLTDEHSPETGGKPSSLYNALCADAEPADPADLPPTTQAIPALIVLEIVRKVLHAWTSAPDRSTRLHGEVLGVALGIPGETVTSLARKYGCTRQAVSKRHRSIVKALSLPPSVRMVLGRTKAAQALHRKNIALPTKTKRRKATNPPTNRG